MRFCMTQRKVNQMAGFNPETYRLALLAAIVDGRSFCLVRY